MTKDMKFDPTEAESSCLALIRQHESGGEYDILCGGTYFKGYAHFPAWHGFRGSHAAGAYQFQPGTWAYIGSKIMLPDFSPDRQDLAALWLLRKYGPNSTISWKASGPYPEVR